MMFTAKHTEIDEKIVYHQRQRYVELKEMIVMSTQPVQTQVQEITNVAVMRVMLEMERCVKVCRS